MDRSTPSGPSEESFSAPVATCGPPPARALLLPAPVDGAGRAGDPAGSPARWVVVSAVVATVVVLVLVVAVGVAVLRGATDATTSSSGATSSVGSLAVGACYRLTTDDRTSDSVGDVTVTSCSQPHDGEVYAKVPLSFDGYPSDAALTSAADWGCGARDSALDSSVASNDTMSTSWYAPLEADWPGSPHVATCVVESDQPNGLTRSWTSTP